MTHYYVGFPSVAGRHPGGDEWQDRLGEMGGIKQYNGRTGPGAFSMSKGALTRTMRAGTYFSDSVDAPGEREDESGTFSYAKKVPNENLGHERVNT